MFETLHKAPADKIFALMAEYAADTNASKIDLGVGVYKDENGATPIMAAIGKAEQRILETARTKTYVGVGGNKGFSSAIVSLTLGADADQSRARAIQAPGGTGAVWVLLKLLQRAKPGATVHLSDPTWPNHKPMVEAAGLSHAFYPYFDAATGTVDFDAMIGTLDKLGPNDIVLLHGCCHNPTGANLTPAQWDVVAESLARTGAFPLIDLAYLGFGDGLEADAYGTRAIARAVPEVVIATSCSKNFGIYRERTGCAIVLAKDSAQADIALSQMLNIVRAVYSQPPDHGAELVRVVLEDDHLRTEWADELEHMRTRMVANREALADAIRQRSNSSDFDFVAEHRGMFSLLGLDVATVQKLKAEHSIYMLDDSRINIAGLGPREIEALADALAALPR